MTDIPAVLHEWRATYEQQLSAPYGWWSIISLDWLQPGDNAVGSNPAGQVLTPERYPAHVATLHHAGDHVVLTPVSDTPLFLGADQLTEPLTITADTNIGIGAGEEQTRLSIVRRFGRWGSRSYDPLEAKRRAATEQVHWFEPASNWRVPATFVPAQAGETVTIQNVIGDEMEIPVAGRLKFTVANEPVTLLATGDESLFINFTDATNRVTTYGGGRFLSMPRPAGPNCVIDFNYVFQPPCAHSAYATCPLPPAGNHIPVPVTAGECLERE